MMPQDYTCSFSYDRKLKDLPNELGELENLEFLNVSFLGLDHLPEGVIKLSKLRTLNISFNTIDLNNEIDKISKLKRLDTLRIYGCNFNQEFLSAMIKLKPDLKILYNRRHYLQEHNPTEGK